MANRREVPLHIHPTPHALTPHTSHIISGQSYNMDEEQKETRMNEAKDSSKIGSNRDNENDKSQYDQPNQTN